MRATDEQPKPREASGLDVNDHLECIYHYIFDNDLENEVYIIKVEKE